jgi:hypothetical protein
MFLVAAVPRGARDAAAGSEVISTVGRLISQKLSDVASAITPNKSTVSPRLSSAACPSSLQRSNLFLPSEYDPLQRM